MDAEFENTLERFDKLAGYARAKTFRAAANFVWDHPGTIIETGCYRGGDQDGHGTLILAMLAEMIGERFHSFELNSEHIARATELIQKAGVLQPIFHLGDSVQNLSRFVDPVRLAYLDSLDIDLLHPEITQQHHLAELGAICGNLVPPCAVLMDDHTPDGRMELGKPFLAAQFLQNRGWRKVVEGYQIMYAKE